MPEELLYRRLTWKEIAITSLLAVLLGILSVGTSTLQQTVISFLTN